jgi:PAS domain S-box-containing protein
MKQTGRLANRLTISFMLAAIAPIAIVSLILGWGFARYSQQVIQTEQSNIVEIGRAYIDRYFSNRVDEIELMGNAMDAADPASISTLELICKRSSEQYISFAVVAADGNEIARLDNCKPAGESSLGNHASEEAFFRAKRGEIFVGNISFNEQSQPVVSISLPIKTRDGKDVIAIGRLELGNLWEPLNELNIAHGGYLFVVDQRGNLVGYRDPEVVKQEKNLASAPSVAPLLVGQPGTNAIRYTGLLGEEVIGTSSSIDQLKWGLVLEQPVSRVYATRNQLAVFLIVILIGFGILAVFIALNSARSIVTPIQQLAQGAEAISRDDLSVVVKVSSQDEIGVTANAFNQMTSRLRELVGSLEKRVADRTHDLELAAEVGRTITEKVANMQEMLTEAVEVIRSQFNLYYTQVYLVDAAGKSLTLRAGTGEAGKQLLSRGHHLPINSSSINGRAVTEKGPVIVADTNKSPNFLSNPLLPNTRSEMVVPLIAGGKVLGVLDMQSETPDALNETNLPAFMVLAGQLSVAVQNAGLFEEREEAQRQMEAHIRRITERGWEDYLNGMDRSEFLGYRFDQAELTPVDHVSETYDPTALDIPLTVAGANVGKLQVIDEKRTWSLHETEILQSIALQLAQHIENLRLFEQAERYRNEANQLVRRLTREGWEEFFKASQLPPAFAYDQRQVRPLSDTAALPEAEMVALPLVVRGENIGRVQVLPNQSMGEVDLEMVNSISGALSAHIENLRLLEESTRSQFNLQTALGQVEAFQAATNAAAIVAITDVKGRIEYVNDNFVNISKYSREELLGQDHRIINSGHHSKEFIRDLWVTIANGIVWRNEIRNKARDGSYYWVDTTISPILNERGKPEKYLAVGFDITERKKAEEAIARRAAELQTVARVSTTTSTVLNPDELLQTVVDLTKERFDLYHAHIYLADDSWNTLLLASGAGEAGRKMVETSHSIQMDAEKSLVARAARERKAIIVNDVRGDADFLPNPLLPNTRSEMAVPMIVGDKVLGVFDVQSDAADHFSEEDANIYTTLAAQVAVALQNARLYVEQAATVTKLRELDRLKSSFLANMSHELRTPLNSILGFTDVMLEELDGPLTENMDNDLRLIQKNGQHLLHLINDVLDMAKIEAGSMSLNPEKFKVHYILDEVVSITSTLASEKNIPLLIEDDSDKNMEIYADRTRIRQVMINIVNNAIKFTERGKITIRAVQQDNANALISVKDTGIGIPPDKLEAIFQEFTQVDTSTTRKAGGTGLGLPISRRLINLHGGRLWAESTGISGEGTTFYIELPLEAQIMEMAGDQEK